MSVEESPLAELSSFLVPPSSFLEKLLAAVGAVAVLLGRVGLQLVDVDELGADGRPPSLFNNRNDRPLTD